jgi:hypothetical protein
MAPQHNTRSHAPQEMLRVQLAAENKQNVLHGTSDCASQWPSRSYTGTRRWPIAWAVHARTLQQHQPMRHRPRTTTAWCTVRRQEAAM